MWSEPWVVWVAWGVEFDLLIRVVSLAEYCSMKGQLLRFDETPLLCLVTDTVRHLYVDSALVVEHHPNPVLELVSRSKKSARSWCGHLSATC